MIVRDVLDLPDGFMSVFDAIHALPPYQAYSDLAARKAPQARILDRNGYACQSCGVAAGDLDERGRPIRLHVDHHEAHITVDHQTTRIYVPCAPPAVRGARTPRRRRPNGFGC